MRDAPIAVQTVVVQSNGPSPGIAALLSFIIPGAGSMYMGSVVLGLVLFCMTVVGYLLFILPGLVMHLVTVMVAATSKPPESRQ